MTRVWQSLLPLFCDKTFEFAIQTWQTSLERYYVYVQTYFLYQLLKMLILLISSYCKMCTLPTLQSRVFVCYERYKHARSYCWQWTHFTMGPYEQNQHFAQLRQNVCLHKYVVVFLTCLPSLDGKRFVTKKWQKFLPNSSQPDYNLVYKKYELHFQANGSANENGSFAIFSLYTFRDVNQIKLKVKE